MPFPERRIDGDAWEPWIDAAAVARHLGVSERTVRRWRVEEGLPSRLIGGSRRFRLSQVEAWHERRAS